MIRRLRTRLAVLKERGQRGAVLVIMTSVMVVLMGAAAMAVDLGWLYVNGLWTQQAADAAALAGVVHLPEDVPAARTAAVTVAAANEYVDVTLGGDATVTPNPVTGKANRLEVTVERSVPTFFMKVFGISQVSISRRAVAEYVLPLPLGSPEPRFGNDPDVGYLPNFWANIHGKWTNRTMGDAFSSACAGGNGSGCSGNEWWRPEGYIYAVEVGAGSDTLTVELFDAPFIQGGGNLVNAGDNPIGGNPGPTTEFILYGPDPTPLDLSDNPELCRRAYAPQPMGTGFVWETFCTVSGALEPGVYPLQVRIIGNDYGLNRFSMRSSVSSGPQTRMYGLGDMSIYANVNSGLTNFYLAEVEEIHRNKTFVVEFFDPGDAQGTNILRIVAPDGSTPPCHLESTNGTDVDLPSCVIDATGRIYNGHWLKATIDLGPGYSCAADCWWRLEYDYTQQATDTTTWTARIEGNPVRLVE